MKTDKDVALNIFGINEAEAPGLLIELDKERAFYKRIRELKGVKVAVHLFYARMEEEIKHLKEDKQHTISCLNCKTGYCCHQQIDVSDDEAKVIVDFCNAVEIPIPHEYLKKQLATTKFMQLKKGCSACVFLKDNRCSIYPVRPAVCRTYFAVSSIHFCDMAKYPKHRVLQATSPPAELIKMAMMYEGGKVDILQKQLLKHSK